MGSGSDESRSDREYPETTYFSTEEDSSSYDEDSSDITNGKSTQLSEKAFNWKIYASRVRNAEVYLPLRHLPRIIADGVVKSKTWPHHLKMVHPQSSRLGYLVLPTRVDISLHNKRVEIYQFIQSKIDGCAWSEDSGQKTKFSVLKRLAFKYLYTRDSWVFRRIFNKICAVQRITTSGKDKTPNLVRYCEKL